MSGNKNLKICLAMALLIPLMPCLAGTKIIYVDADANGLNDGSSWANAYNYLQDALADANSSAKANVIASERSERGNLNTIIEIRVAQGIYRPDESAVEPNGTGNREATFQLINGVTLKGGYAGFGEADPNARDTVLYQTILSGDIGKPLDKSDNCYHLFYHPEGLNLDVTAILDGFTITGGNAYGSSWPHYFGGGMYNNESSPTLNNCTFSDNSAGYGGGMRNDNSNPNVNNCTFIVNSAYDGGGMCNDFSSPTLNNCTFIVNSAGCGSGMFNDDGSSPKVTNCTFTNNSAQYWGGGMLNDGYSSPTVTNCTFTGNSASDCGGGMVNFSGSPTVKDCTFSYNSANEGGGIDNVGCSPTVTNCTFRGNSAIVGGGMFNYGNSPMIKGCTFRGNSAEYGYGGGMCNWERSSPSVTNCILWADVPSEIYVYDGQPIVTYSDIQGGWPGEGNIDKDPCFAQPGYWDANGTLADTNDDFWVDGDYHLKSQAGRWDANEGRWMKDNKTSLCIDAGDPNSPIGFEPFPNGGRINMGAYGGTAEASKSYFGEPPCETIVSGDINGDCKVNFLDFALMAFHWLKEY